MLTLAIIKPDAVHAGKTGKILAQLEGAGFQIRAARLVKLTTAQAEAFYAVHRERPFYRPLVAFMTSGPALALALSARTPWRGCGRSSARPIPQRRSPEPCENCTLSRRSETRFTPPIRPRTRRVKWRFSSRSESCASLVDSSPTRV